MGIAHNLARSGQINHKEVSSLRKWPHKVIGYTKLEVVVHCINHTSWQQFRLSMKGQNTEVKLGMLNGWHNLYGHTDAGQIQVDNYLGALRRGGQLDEHYAVRKER